MSYVDAIISELTALGSLKKAHNNARFFKIQPGDYADYDVFLGVSLPEIRSIAARFTQIGFDDLTTLFHSQFHEVRLCAAIILSRQYLEAGSTSDNNYFFEFYLKQVNGGFINNWDIVDVSAPIFGRHLLICSNSSEILTRLTKSTSLWERRVAVMFTFAFIKEGIYHPTYSIAMDCLVDEEDLIHKATGWMLREMGKRDIALLRKFLTEHSHVMPRTMLRYAIEKLPESERKKWLKVKKS
jgi:3-methyladenine DNA glycosylase AlkD